MNPAFCRLQIIVEDRPLYDASGKVVTDRPPMHSGDTIFHWAAPELAMVWFREAARLCGDNAAIAALDAPVDTQNYTANSAQAARQLDYVTKILKYLARGYNLLNLVWWNDPPARALYRFYVAGPPRAYGPNTSRAVFQQDEDYNPGWYTGTSELPLASTGGGVIPQAALRQLQYPSGVSFLISAGLLLTSVDAPGTTETVESSTAVRNAAFTRMLYHQVCPGWVDFPWNNQCAWSSLGMIAGADRKAVMPDGTVLPRYVDDWRAAYAGSFYNNGYNGIAAPLRSYLPYLAAWANAIVSRTPYQIIQDARAYAVYENDRTFYFNGGIQSGVQSILGTDADVMAQQSAPNSGLNTAAAAAVTLGTTIGAAVGGVGAAVGALVGGAVALVTKLIGAVIPGAVSGHGRDDLGRYKLRFERGWLSGDPGSQDPNDGAPMLAPDDFSDPPITVSLAASLNHRSLTDCPSGPVQAPPSPVGPLGQSTSGTSFPWGTVLTITGLGAAAAIGYSVLRRRKSNRRKR